MMWHMFKYRIAVIWGFVLFMVACDATIHEYPNPGKSLVILEPHVNREPPLYYKEVVYDNKWNRTVRDLDEVPARPYVPWEEFEMRLLLDIYEGQVNDTRNSGGQGRKVERRELRLDKDARPPQDTVHVFLPMGDYYVLAWADYCCKDKQKPVFYKADTLFSVKNDIKNYPANTHHRSTSAGQESFAIDYNLGPEGYPVVQADRYSPIQSRKIPVMMNRPSARYRVIASDFAEFTRDGGSLEGAVVKVVYKQYVTAGYNVATCEPNLFISTYSFNTSLTQEVFDKDTHISMFGDYLFTSSDKEDVVIVDFYFYDSSGNEFNHCENIEIPLKRDHETIVRGCFLTNKVEKDSNISIDENFEGEYTVEIN